MTNTGQNDFTVGLVKQFESSFPISWWKNSKVVVGVSGGPDSVALLNLFREVAGSNKLLANLIVVHCNHRTRAASDKDEAFVRRLCQTLQITFVNKTREVTKSKSEHALRDFRYQALSEVALQFGARYIITGHTLDDQVETILFRMLRGTGISGLRGIPKIRVLKGVTIVRPLLCVTKADLLKFLKEIDQGFVVDESNSDVSYKRNFIREELLPIIEHEFPEYRGALLRLATQSDQIEDLLDQLSSNLPQTKLASATNAQIDVTRFRDQPRPVVGQFLKRHWRSLGHSEQAMSQDKWDLLIDLAIDKTKKSVQLPAKITAIRSGDIISFQVTETIRR